MAKTNRSTSTRRESSEEKQNLALYLKARRERKPVLPVGFAEQVEKDLTGPGKYAVPRRMALAFLSSTFSEMADKTKKGDRNLVLAIDSTIDALHHAIRSHESLVAWLRLAQFRMAMCLATREDMAEIIAEGNAVTKEATAGDLVHG